MSEMVEAELLAIQKAGAEARAAGVTVFRNPYYSPEAMPAVVGGTVDEWERKAVAWDLGWKVEDALAH